MGCRPALISSTLGWLDAYAALSLASALQAQTPILSKEYIRLGGSILAIEQAASPGYATPPYTGWSYLNQSPDSGWTGQGT